MECPVCYCNQANCKLICKHSFCKGCVKEWYYASSEPSCPMCRKRLYFKGMYKIMDIWEQERFEKKNQEAFGEAFDNLFETETIQNNVLNLDEVDSDSDSEYGDYSEQDFGPISDTDSDIDSLSDSDWSQFSGWGITQDYRLLDIQEMQNRYRILQNSGFGIESELLENDYYEVFNDYEHFWFEDTPIKNLFISNHIGMQNGEKRCGARATGKRDAAPIELAVVLICV